MGDRILAGECRSREGWRRWLPLVPIPMEQGVLENGWEMGDMI